MIYIHFRTAESEDEIEKEKTIEWKCNEHLEKWNLYIDSNTAENILLIRAPMLIAALMDVYVTRTGHCLHALIIALYVIKYE